MGSRLELQSILETLLGTKYAYFQPPPDIQMVYPCIVYQRNDVNYKYADNHLYKVRYGYDLTLIDKNPDSTFVDLILMLPYCTFDRHYVSDNLHHDSFKLFF